MWFMKIRILVADGDERVRNELKELFKHEGYDVDLVGDGITAIKHYRRYEYHLSIVDTNLPELDGRNVCRQFRKMSKTPFIIISEESDEDSILEGYESGAEDYLTKPFSLRELLARVNVILRRNIKGEKIPTRNLVFDGLIIDTYSHNVYVDECKVILTPKEYDLLAMLAKSPEQAFSRGMLIDAIWGNDYYGTDRTVDTHIKTLREALKPRHYYISTIRGFGYKFNEIAVYDNEKAKKRERKHLNKAGSKAAKG